ncbi:transthyretin-like family domain-containing protein [Ditylenchus destructor]|uniref:Transthyretin-like family domain-containing protein n=1 Tax=Ditylenchus destructor TaxID=166010 RepID=A0AAD4MPD5_9BILA|nr:transthyretin-like family domain-containing protein [Ditylenchus destructor]
MVLIRMRSSTTTERLLTNALVGADWTLTYWSLEATGHVLCHGRAVHNLTVDALTWVFSNSKLKWKNFATTKTNETGHFYIHGNADQPVGNMSDTFFVQLQIEHTCDNQPPSKFCITVPHDPYMCEHPCQEQKIFEAGDIQLGKPSKDDCHSPWISS